MDKVKTKDETTIAYLKDGSGLILVLVHGSGSIAKRWNTVMPALTKDFTVCSMEVLPVQKHVAMVTASELFVKVLKNFFLEEVN